MMNTRRTRDSFLSNLKGGRWLVVSAILVGGLIMEEALRTSISSESKPDSPKNERRVLINGAKRASELSISSSSPLSTGDQSSNDTDRISPQPPSSPDGAEDLQALHPTDRIALVAAALQQASRKSPEAVVSEAIRFCDLDPSYSLEYGRALISILASSHNYSAALRFVLAEESEGELGENGNKWLNTLFITWGKDEPRRAAQAVDTVVSPGLRSEALQALAAGWAKTDPAGLADYVWQRPPTTEREYMLEVALNSWVESDPTAAEAWMARRKTSLK